MRQFCFHCFRGDIIWGVGAEDHTAVAVWKSLPKGKCVCGQRHAVCCKVTNLDRKVGCVIAQSQPQAEAELL